MGNVVNSIDEQIEKLKSRGLDLNCYSADKIKELLLDIGYYRLGYYTYYFIDQETEMFEEGVKISDIIKLYYLDMDLKFLLMRYINRIEINFRTKVVYYVSMKYKEDCCWYVNPDVVFDVGVDYFSDKIYTSKFISDNLTLKRHHINHPDDEYAPCWKVFEYLTFGSLIAIYSSIRDDNVKQRVSEKYGIKTLRKFFKLIHVVRQVRNICAHSGVLFDFSLPTSISSIPQISFNKGDRNSLDASLKVIGFFINTISENRYAEYKSEIFTLFSTAMTNPQLKKMIREKIKYLD